MTDHPGFGATLEVDWTGGTSYSAIAQVRDFDGPGPTRDSIDVANQDSTDAWRGFLPGLTDAGEATFDLLLDPTGGGHTALFTPTGSCVMPAWRLTSKVCNGCGIWLFNGFVTNVALHVAFEDALKADVTVKISGTMTFTSCEEKMGTYVTETTCLNVAGTPVTIVPDGSGDAAHGVTVTYRVVTSGGDAGGGAVTVDLGDTYDLFDDGTNVLTLTVAANGSVTIVRSGGSVTFDISLQAIWI